MPRDLHCPVCYERFNIPQALPCQHTFCQRCIERCTRNGEIVCPECRREFEVPPDGFPINILATRMLNASSLESSVESTQVGLPNAAFYDGHAAIQGPILEPTAPLLPGEDGRGQLNRSSCIKKTEDILTEFLRRYKRYIPYVAAVFLLITIARFVAGSVKLYASCAQEQTVAHYLFVKSCVAFLFWIVILLLSLRTEIEDMFQNRWIEVHVVLDTVFSIVWLIYGTVWSTAMYNKSRDVCPKHVPNWDSNFMNFAIFLNVLDWIGVVAFGFYLGYIACDD